MYIDRDGNGHFQGDECHAAGYDPTDDLILFTVLEGHREGATIYQPAESIELTGTRTEEE